MATSKATAPAGRRDDEEERHRLSTLEGLAALSLDALSSVAYGPEAILIVLVAAGRRLLVLIAELEPMRAWQWILHNQRGAVLERALRHDTSNVVVCRIRFRPTTWSAN